MIHTTIKRSLYDPSFYAEQMNATFGRAFGYFLKLALILSCIGTIAFGLFDIGVIKSIVSEENIRSLADLYPKELVVTIHDGTASTNVKEPYTIPVPPMWLEGADARSPRNLLVIDTRNPDAFSNFAAYDTFILLTKEYVIMRDDNRGQIRGQSLSGIGNEIITHERVEILANKIAPFVKFFVPLALVAYFFVIFIGLSVGVLLSLVVLAFVVWIVYKLSNRPISYLQIYKLGFYTVTAGLIIDLLLGLVGINVPWFFLALIFLISYFINIRLPRTS